MEQEVMKKKTNIGNL